MIDSCLRHDLKPGRVLVDSFYGNSGPCVYLELPGDKRREKHRLDNVAKILTAEQLTKVTLPLDKPRDVWVARFLVHFPKLEGTVQRNAMHRTRRRSHAASRHRIHDEPANV